MPEIPSNLSGPETGRRGKLISPSIDGVTPGNANYYLCVVDLPLGLDVSNFFEAPSESGSTVLNFTYQGDLLSDLQNLVNANAPITTYMLPVYTYQNIAAPNSNGTNLSMLITDGQSPANTITGGNPNIRRPPIVEITSHNMNFQPSVLMFQSATTSLIGQPNYFIAVLVWSQTMGFSNQLSLNPSVNVSQIGNDTLSLVASLNTYDAGGDIPPTPNVHNGSNSPVVAIGTYACIAYQFTNVYVSYADPNGGGGNLNGTMIDLTSYDGTSSTDFSCSIRLL